MPQFQLRWAIEAGEGEGGGREEKGRRRLGERTTCIHRNCLGRNLRHSILLEMHLACRSAETYIKCSEFFEQLQSVQENVDDPMAKVSTTYRQQSYIAKNLPYVVCITIIM